MFGRNSEGMSMWFDTSTVLKKVRENLAAHLANYEVAKKQYQKELVEVLEAKLAAAKEGKKVQHHILLSYPKSYRTQYEQAIAMLEATTDPKLELDTVIFRQLMLDEWDWKNDFETSTMGYANKVRNMPDTSEDAGV